MPSLHSARAELVTRLRSRRPELEEAILIRVRNAVPDAAGGNNAEYVTGLREVVAAVVDYGLLSIERSEEWSGSIPLEAVAQTRRAVRNGMSLNTVLRRYVVGYALLWDFIMEEADLTGPSRGPSIALLRQASAALASLLGPLMASIADAYIHEVERTARSYEQRRTERVQALLAGAPVDASELGYDLDAEHIGLIATGADAEEALRRMAAALDRQVLTVSPSAGTRWAWLGGRRALRIADVERLLCDLGLPNVSLTIGESATGTAGFRHTHRQAQAALWVAQRRPQRVTRYADVALLALALQDEGMAQSLVEIYLSPLGDHGDGGTTLCQTLRAYFAAGHNASAAASSLGVDRRTVWNRLRVIEERLGCLLHTRQAEIEIALRLDELRSAASRFEHQQFSG